MRNLCGSAPSRLCWNATFSSSTHIAEKSNHSPPDLPRLLYLGMDAWMNKNTRKNSTYRASLQENSWAASGSLSQGPVPIPAAWRQERGGAPTGTTGVTPHEPVSPWESPRHITNYLLWHIAIPFTLPGPECCTGRAIVRTKRFLLVLRLNTGTFRTLASFIVKRTWIEAPQPDGSVRLEA